MGYVMVVVKLANLARYRAFDRIWAKKYQFLIMYRKQTSKLAHCERKLQRSFFIRAKT